MGLCRSPHCHTTPHSNKVAESCMDEDLKRGVLVRRHSVALEASNFCLSTRQMREAAAAQPAAPRAVRGQRTESVGWPCCQVVKEWCLCWVSSSRTEALCVQRARAVVVQPVIVAEALPLEPFDTARKRAVVPAQTALPRRGMRPAQPHYGARGAGGRGGCRQAERQLCGGLANS